MEYKVSDPRAAVLAANIRSTIEAFRLLPDVARRVIERHELEVTDAAPGTYLPLQRWLDALAEIESRVGQVKLRDIGRKVIQNAQVPPLDTETLLLQLDRVYQTNHRGEVGRYISERHDDGAIIVHCETPYPRHFEWGLIEGFCRHPDAARGARFLVDYIEHPPGGDRTCTLVVRKI